MEESVKDNNNSSIVADYEKYITVAMQYISPQHAHPYSGIMDVLTQHFNRVFLHLMDRI